MHKQPKKGSSVFLSGMNDTKFPLMLVMLVVLMCVLGDDTQAFQDTLSSLCSLNKEGKFGSCCVSYDINSVTLAYSAARNCFISSLSFTRGSILNSLFVFHLLLDFFSFSGTLNTKD